MDRLTQLIGTLSQIESLVESDAERELARRHSRATGTGHAGVLRLARLHGHLPPLDAFLAAPAQTQNSEFEALLRDHGPEAALEFLGTVLARTGFAPPSPYWRLVELFRTPVTERLARSLERIPPGGFETWLAERGFEPSPARPGWHVGSVNDRVHVSVAQPPSLLLSRLHPEPGALLSRAVPRGLNQSGIRQQLAADDFAAGTIGLEFSTKPGGRRIELSIMGLRGSAGQLFSLMTDLPLDAILD